jgi:hypothetical protein
VSPPVSPRCAAPIGCAGSTLAPGCSTSRAAEVDLLLLAYDDTLAANEIARVATAGISHPCRETQRKFHE